jgi:hypothetical protein
MLGVTVGGADELQAISSAAMMTIASRQVGDFIDKFLFGCGPFEEDTPFIQLGFRCSPTVSEPTLPEAGPFH